MENVNKQGVTSERLKLLSVVIPARDEEGCIASTLEHLHLELELRGVPHEIVVVDDGSSDRTWEILQNEQARIPQLLPVKSPGPHGFGRAITRGLDAMTGDAVVIMMADESDDSRDVVRYWEKLNEGYDCVFG
jgi:dolichol-phosphate mannosyltransferase